MKKRTNINTLIICFVIVFIVAFIGSLFTSSNVDTAWYESIKPSITPPNYVFPIVWTILFILIAFSLYFAWIGAKNKATNKKIKRQKKKVVLVFGINFILNILWSFLFFYLKNPAYAFIDLILLWISILAMIIVVWESDKKASWLLIPYLAWVSFAGILNWLMV